MLQHLLLAHSHRRLHLLLPLRLIVLLTRPAERHSLLPLMVYGKLLAMKGFGLYGEDCPLP